MIGSERRFELSFWIAVLCLAAAMSLAVWLSLWLRFDLGTSPAWQVAPYFAMMGFLLAATVALGIYAQGPFGWMGRARRLLPFVPPVALGVFFLLGWGDGQPHSGFRDPGWLPMVMKAAAVSVLVVCVLGALQAVLGLFLGAAYGLGGPVDVPGSRAEPVPPAGMVIRCRRPREGPSTIETFR